MSPLSRFVFAGSALALALGGCAQPVDAPSDAAPAAPSQTVRLQGTAGGEVEFTGAVQSITPPRLVVSGITVVTTPATEIKRGNQRIPLTDLRIGESVKVEGTLEADGSVNGREIQANAAPQPTPSPSATPSPLPTPTPSPTPRPSPSPTVSPGPTPSPSPTPDDDDDDDDDEDEMEFTGTIQSITPPSLVVSGRTVMTDGRTEFKGEGRIHSLNDLHVGDRVEVEGRLMTDGATVLASEIKRR